MGQIHVLSKETIDKIAAGEVVERPASVVKELVENAIDAGALAVTVEIKEGGISLIRVTDNGCGIDKGEIDIAFLRHATSKIQSADDLFRIGSLGFRGEALSSICAVSMLELITKTKDQLTGVRCVMEGGIEKEVEEIGAPTGTTIIVRNLFYNTPVRKKFLKQPQTEAGYISELMEHIALSHPGISFKFIQNGQVKFQTSGNENLKEVIYRIYGREINEALLPVDREKDGVRMYGFIGKPEINRANRNFENFSVNGRYIKSKLISQALEDGYKNYLMQHKFPFVVLHFEVVSEYVDVNVHPTKMEVRFKNQEGLYSFVSSEVSACLGARELIPQVQLTQHTPDLPPAPKKILAPEPFETMRRSSNILREDPIFNSIPDPIHAPIPVVKMQDILQNSVATCRKDEKTSINESDSAINTQINLFEEPKLLSEQSKNQYRMLGQIFDTYWLIIFQEKLFIIDQHAAHEKVKYEALMKEISLKKVVSQMLMPPIIVTLSGREENILKEYASCFEELGFEMEAFGGNEYAVRSVPAELYGLKQKELFLEMLDELSENPVKEGFSFISRKIAMTACKAAVKGNTTLSEKEMESLIDQLLELEDPYHCPHGRPTIISMSKYEIEKKFKRIV